MDTRYISAESLFQFFSSDKASSKDEFMFLGLAIKCGFQEAAYWASEFGWQVQRPLQVLRAMANEPGEDHSAQ